MCSSLRCECRTSRRRNRASRFLAAVYPPKIKKKSYFQLIVCAVVLLTFLAVTIQTGLRNNSLQTKRLPDGTLLSIVSISYGLNHSYDLKLSRWKLFVMHYLPAHWTEIIGWQNVDGNVSAKADPGEPPFLVIFTVAKKASAAGSSSNLQLDLCDERKNIFDSISRGPTVTDQNLKLVGWVVSKPLPKSKRLILRFNAVAADKTLIQVAEFNVPNPCATLPEKMQTISN
jgi:hypothetical protein